MPIDALPDELLLAILRCLDGVALLRAGAASQQLRAIADDDATSLWRQLCFSRWPVTEGLQYVISYKFLWAQMCKLDAGTVAPWSIPPASPLQFMVRVFFDPSATPLEHDEELSKE